MKNYFFYLIVMFAFLFTQLNCSDSCLYSGCNTLYYLTEIKPLPDTTLSTGDTLQLDITEYYQLGEDNPGGKFAGYATLEPILEDRSIAEIAYDYGLDTYGENFQVTTLNEGETEVIMNFSFDGGGDSQELAHIQRRFKLTVIDESFK